MTLDLSFPSFRMLMSQLLSKRDLVLGIVLQILHGGRVGCLLHQLLRSFLLIQLFTLLLVLYLVSRCRYWSCFKIAIPVIVLL